VCWDGWIFRYVLVRWAICRRQPATPADEAQYQATLCDCSHHYTSTSAAHNRRPSAVIALSRGHRRSPGRRPTRRRRPAGTGRRPNSWQGGVDPVAAAPWSSSLGKLSHSNSDRMCRVHHSCTVPVGHPVARPPRSASSHFGTPLLRPPEQINSQFSSSPTAIVGIESTALRFLSLRRRQRKRSLNITVSTPSGRRSRVTLIKKANGYTTRSLSASCIEIAISRLKSGWPVLWMQGAQCMWPVNQNKLDKDCSPHMRVHLGLMQIHRCVECGYWLHIGATEVPSWWWPSNSVTPMTSYIIIIIRLSNRRSAWMDGVTISTELITNGAIIWSRMNCSGYLRHVTILSWMLTTACCHSSRVRIRFSVWLVCVYAHVVALLSVVIVTHPHQWTRCLLVRPSQVTPVVNEQSCVGALKSLLNLIKTRHYG